jgi:hypothetical protein
LNSNQIVKALSSISEKRLLLIDLLNEVTNKKGDIDYELLTERQPQVNLARAQAQAWVTEISRAVIALRKI